MAKIISVLSGKGGTGKSTVTALLGIAAAKAGKRVLLADFDAPLHSLDLLLSMQDQIVFDLSDVLKEKIRIKQAIYPHPDLPLLSLCCAQQSGQDQSSLVKQAALLRGIQNGYDLILLDLPAGLFCSADIANSVSDEAVLGLTPDIICVRDAQKLAPMLSVPARLVFNKVDRDAVKSGGLVDLDEAMDLCGTALLGVVPFVKNAAGLVNKGGAGEKKVMQIADAIVSRLTGSYIPLILKTV